MHTGTWVVSSDPGSFCSWTSNTVWNYLGWVITLLQFLNPTFLWTLYMNIAPDVCRHVLTVQQLKKAFWAETFCWLFYMLLELLVILPSWSYIITYPPRQGATHFGMLLSGTVNNVNCIDSPLPLLVRPDHTTACRADSPQVNNLQVGLHSLAPHVDKLYTFKLVNSLPCTVYHCPLTQL